MSKSSKSNKVIDLFVPGRLCLFGEHSDWAGMHRMVNSGIETGYAIVSGTEEGIYAKAEKADEFIVESKLSVYHHEKLVCPMNTAKLLEIAKEGKFFSYVAGVASYINDNFSVGGVKITITKMDLPIKSGLSSSAAICVLVARAFNRLYNLRMNTKGEMQAAFSGEQRTPSRCGRLDQACAYGVKPVWMEFDGMELETNAISIGTTFHWLIADLKSHKDTVKILSDLNKCFPFAEDEKERSVQEALGVDNQEIVRRARRYMEQGDAASLGQLMVEAQENFDQKVAPACPEELTSPVLHSVLEDEKIQQWIYGAKGVGSQGDGTVQFLARDEKSREQLMMYLEKEKGMPSFALTLRPGQTVKKAIVPVAGFGTRLYPATKEVKKAFMPLVDKDGMLKPTILIILEQLVEAGIEEICLVIGEDERAEYEAFFTPLAEEYRQKLSEERQALEEQIVSIGKKVTYIVQRERLGFGHAVFQCKGFTEHEPVLLLLGDMVYESYEEENCCKQIIDAFQNCGKTLVSIHEVQQEEVMHYGILHGQWENQRETLMKVDCMYEKPTQDYAREYLAVGNNRKEDKFYAVFGQYVLTPEVFDELEKNMKKGKTSVGEYQLTDALDTVREQYGMYGYKPNGKSYDCGLPEVYRETMWKFGRKKEQTWNSAVY